MKRQIIVGDKGGAAPASRSRRQSQTAGAPCGLPRFVKPSDGKPMEASVRSAAERAYGRDLKDVRVHTDGEAASSADALHARAYASGRDIVFGAGAYAPGSSEGQRLIAHELAHVVQQSGGRSPSLSTPSGSFESAADSAADHAVRGEPARLDVGPAAPAVQRQALPSIKPPTMLARAMGSGTIDSFATGSSTLNGAQKARIASIAASILSLRESYPGCTVSVTGHTDAIGAETNNIVLGQARADAVRDELAANGVPAEIVITDSAGEAQLKVPTQAAEPRNRRVEIQFEPEARFHVIPELTPPPAVSPSPAPAAPIAPAAPVAPAAPPPELFPPVLRPPYADPNAETPAEAGRRIFRPIPPDPRKPRPPLLGPLIDKIDTALKGMGLPDWARDIVKDGAKAAVVKGATASADAAMDQTNMSSEQKRAIHSLIEAAIKGELP
jgi:outer membrane protein OmpA-like peptidoglycan-associated protein